MTAEFQRISFSDGFDTEEPMATVTITLNGSALPGLASNPSKTYTVSDADLQRILTYAQKSFAGLYPTNPTNAQLLVAWLQGQLINPTMSGEQQTGVSVTTPPPISVT